jgi:hypothetical protein
VVHNLPRLPKHNFSRKTTKLHAVNDGVDVAVSTKDAPAKIRNWRFIIFALMWAGYGMKQKCITIFFAK